MNTYLVHFRIVSQHILDARQQRLGTFAQCPRRLLDRPLLRVIQGQSVHSICV